MFVGFNFCYFFVKESLKNKTLIHENLDSIGYYDDVLRAYNENKTMKIIFKV